MNPRIFKVITKLTKITRAHKRMMDSQTAEVGIHGTQRRILMYLARKGNLPSQKTLAEYFEVTPAAITGALKKLEHDGYIERTIGTDNRYNEVTITEKGREVTDKTRELFAGMEESLFDGFSEEDIAKLTAYLDRILENLSI